MTTINPWDSSYPNRKGTLRTNHEVVPVVKLPEKKTYNPWDWVSCTSCIVKLQDLVSRDGTHTNKIYQEIVDVGGIHQYFGWNGNIILSSIAPDITISGLSKEMYADIICNLQPDSYLTPDAETYLGKSEYELSSHEIERIIDETEYIIHECTNANPIGLVKGSNLDQVEYHTVSLQGYGIEKYCFHAGDYLSRSSSNTINTAIRFQTAIRDRVDYLITYGVGSRKSMRQFSDADVFVTQTHYTRVFKGEYLVNGKWIKKPASYQISQEMIMNNLLGLSNIAGDLINGQCTLDYWFCDNSIQTGIDFEKLPIISSPVQGGG